MAWYRFRSLLNQNLSHGVNISSERGAPWRRCCVDASIGSI